MYITQIQNVLYIRSSFFQKYIGWIELIGWCNCACKTQDYKIIISKKRDTFLEIAILQLCIVFNWVSHFYQWHIYF